jgi:hypothetical protein
VGYARWTPTVAKSDGVTVRAMATELRRPNVTKTDINFPDMERLLTPLGKTFPLAKGSKRYVGVGPGA